MNQVLVSGELGVDLDCFALGEGLDSGVAVGAEQDSDRRVQFLVELMGEGKREGESTRSQRRPFSNPPRKWPVFEGKGRKSFRR